LPLILTLAGVFAGLWIFLLPIASLTSGGVSVVVGRIGTCLFIGVLATAAWLDWRGLVSMRGLIDWSKIHGWARFLLGLVLVLVVEFVLGIYLVRAAYMTWRTRPGPQAAPLPAASSITQRMRTSAAGFAVLGVVFACAFAFYSLGNVGATPDSQPPATSQSNANTGGNQGAQNTVIASTATSTATIAPTAVPTKAPTATHCADPCNPWGYNFVRGNVIRDPPAEFCNYFDCIPSFWNGSGYVMECRDAMYSLSGGRSGSCSRHGGDWRILYSH
jgi:hypothetical protein